MLNLIQKKFPINAILKNNKKILLKNYYETYLISFGILEGYKIENNVIEIFNYDSNKITIDLGNNNGDIYGVFFEKVYEFLPVKDAVVIDIGANIADSSIYFALRGAKKIIAVEPLPQNFNLAKKNIEINNLNDKIELLLSGCSDKKSHMMIDDLKAGAGSNLKTSGNGIQIPLITLDDIFSKFQLDSAILKMDCEGCEYNSLLNASRSLLSKFSHIVIEYHFGYKNIQKKLESCGFKVTVTDPKFIRNRQAGKSMFYGYLYATNIGNDQNLSQK